MPLKRARGESLTGGTGDVNPQFYSITIVQTAADTAITQAYPVPIPRYPGSANRAIVMEILSVTFTVDDLVNVANTQSIVCVLSTATVANSAFAALIDPHTIAQFNLDFLFATAAGFQFTDARVNKLDLTDEAGHGILVGTDNLFLTMFTANTGRTNSINARIKYRMKEVGLAEYVGIVQSQQ